jgi:hypothetical protein
MDAHEYAVSMSVGYRHALVERNETIIRPSHNRFEADLPQRLLKSQGDIKRHAFFRDNVLSDSTAIMTAVPRINDDGRKRNGRHRFDSRGRRRALPRLAALDPRLSCRLKPEQQTYEENHAKKTRKEAHRKTETWVAFPINTVNLAKVAKAFSAPLDSEN